MRLHQGWGTRLPGSNRPAAYPLRNPGDVKRGTKSASNGRRKGNRRRKAPTPPLMELASVDFRPFEYCYGRPFGQEISPQQAAEKGLIAEENGSDGVPQGLKPIDFIGFIGILRLRSGQA